MKSFDVFNPNGFPTHTYVNRQLLDDAGNEYDPGDQLEFDIQVPGRIISLAGPSKSGKTVLIERIAGDALIKISGAEINERDFWEIILDAIGAPTEVTTQSLSNLQSTQETSATAEAGIPFGAAKLGVTAKQSHNKSTENSIEELQKRSSYSEVARTALQEKIILIDDFHYITPEKQQKLAKQLKHIAEEYKTKICVAQVLHKGESIIRSNPDLAGRVSNIDFKYWQEKDLIKIGDGFKLLNIQLNDAAISAFAIESAGSPQLMQLICLNACIILGATEKQDNPTTFNLPLDKIHEIISTAIRNTQRQGIYNFLIKGPDVRGNPRSSHTAADNNKADVYQAILLGIALDPPKLSMPRDELIKRVCAIIGTNSIPASTITQSIKQHLTKLITKYNKEQPPTSQIDYFEWDDETGLHIEDPYFLFYCRWQPRAKAMRGFVEKSYLTR